MLRGISLLILLLTGCATPPAHPAYPRTVAGLTLEGEQVLTGADVPPYVPPAGVVRAVRLTYSGSQLVQAIVYETSGSSVAFAALQSWRAETGKLAIHSGRYFVVAQGRRPGLDDFLAGLEKQLK
ncbi:MAG: hypothetical protein K2X03_11775 [Bryobacteraceae bacterium]|nr:hypothetical protein [Bryobacteraceae bacterium]